mmetsp:Transcript_101210/g.326671  ORF Transcript_101210/g.326671 Transcript_101210/m.326671 type:complete len:257 (+) Transcript_101210:470-1240(+)
MVDFAHQVGAHNGSVDGAVDNLNLQTLHLTDARALLLYGPCFLRPQCTQEVAEVLVGFGLAVGPPSLPGHPLHEACTLEKLSLFIRGKRHIDAQLRAHRQGHQRPQEHLLHCCTLVGAKPGRADDATAAVRCEGDAHEKPGHGADAKAEGGLDPVHLLAKLAVAAHLQVERHRAEQPATATHQEEARLPAAREAHATGLLQRGEKAVLQEDRVVRPEHPVPELWRHLSLGAAQALDGDAARTVARSRDARGAGANI